MVHGIMSRLIVIGVDKVKETAVVTTTTTPPFSYTVPWSTLTPLD
jgi:hypothetical protein